MFTGLAAGGLMQLQKQHLNGLLMILAIPVTVKTLTHGSKTNLKMLEGIIIHKLREMLEAAKSKITGDHDYYHGEVSGLEEALSLLDQLSNSK